MNANMKFKARIPLEECRKLAPDLNGTCLSSNLITRHEHYGASGNSISSGWYSHHGIYGIFELENKEKTVVNLKQFEYLNDGYDFIDSIKKK
jgi:hypothetical protein